MINPENYEDHATNETNYDDHDDEAHQSYLRKRCEILGFEPQKELFWNKYLPYADKLDDESQQLLATIKENLAKAIALHDFEPGVPIYADRFHTYLDLYGLKFSKDDHINFIKIFVDLICLKDLEPSRLNAYCLILNELLRKPFILSPDDLQIEWRPLYHLFEIYLHDSTKKGFFYTFISNYQNHLKETIEKCSFYFPKSSTEEILGEFLPKLCPLDTDKRHCQIFEIMHLFLNYRNGHELWLDDFMNIWNTYHNPPWSRDMMSIMSNVAYENIGKIDWEPYMSIMFSRFLKELDLPVTFKNHQIAKNNHFNAINVAKWIIAVLGPNTSGQKYLSKFIRAIETYIHPANMGKWVKNIGQLLIALPEYFVNRLKYERFYKLRSWMDPVPESHKLTEQCITDFVESLKSASFTAMYSSISSLQVSKMFHDLALLRPALIIPDIIERVCTNFESLTEPHRLTSSLQCLVGVSTSIITGANGYTDSRKDIIPILFAALPGIDPNDMKKSFLTLNFCGTFIYQMPIVDCSKAGQYYDDLTEDESIICEQTANFEDFILQFLDKLFLMIKYNTRENVRMEQSNNIIRSGMDIVVERALSNGLQIIDQCSEEILSSATRKVIYFIQNNIIDPKSGTALLGALISSFSFTAGSLMLKPLVPYLTKKIQKYIDEHEDAENIEKQSDDFLYYLTILYYLCKGDPRETIKYLDEYLIPILDKIMLFKCKSTQRLVYGIIFNFSSNISKIYVFNGKANDENLKKPLSEYLPIRNWGEIMKSNEKINWFIPDENERLACEKLLHRYLPDILKRLNSHNNDNIKTNRDDILRDLKYILSFLWGMSNFLPIWNDEPIKILCDTCVDLNAFNLTLNCHEKIINMPNGDNVRKTIANVIFELVDKLLDYSVDDVESLKEITYILDRIHSFKTSSYYEEVKLYKNMKYFQKSKLTKKKQHNKTLITKRVLYQQTCREQISKNYTETHCKILKSLLKLSKSRYPFVRLLARARIFEIFETYKFSYTDIIDDLIKSLLLDPNEYSDEFEGVLFLLIGSYKNRILINNEWNFIEKIWLAILRSKPSEKKPILLLMDSIYTIIKNEFATISIEMNINLTMKCKLLENTFKLINNNENDLIKLDDIDSGKMKLCKKNEENRKFYKRLIDTIVDIAMNTQNLDWRYHRLASTMLRSLGHPQIKYPISVAKYAIHNLLNDSINERKISTDILNAVLLQQKRQHVHIKIDPFEVAKLSKSFTSSPSSSSSLSSVLVNESKKSNEKLSFGIRDDNRWLQYDFNNLPKNQTDWDKPYYLHKANGYFGWSTNLEIYAPTDQQPSIDRQRHEMNDIEQLIYDFFIDTDNIKKFIKFSSMEENKGNEKFKRLQFGLFKYLFKIYGDQFLSNLIPIIEKLIKENKIESNHRCAAEILCGIMRGMKHWPYDKTMETYQKLVPLIRLALDYVTVETDSFWGTCFATASARFDPRRQYWLHEVLMEDPMKKSSSFIDCCRIFFLQGPFHQHSWRMNSCAHRLLEYLKPYLDHDFQNNRLRLSSLLTNIFEADLQFKNGNPPECPRIKDMIDEVVKKLTPLNVDVLSTSLSEKEDSDEYTKAVRLFKTICQWIIGNIKHCTNGNEASYFDLLPYACRFESCEQDNELAETSTLFLVMISQALTLPDRMDYALNKIDEVSKSISWNSRLAVIDALQNLVFHNMAIILSNDKWVQNVQNIVFRLLEDTSLEVRLKAAQVLGGLLHCSFLPSTDKLLEKFKRKCKTKIVRKNQQQQQKFLMEAGPSTSELNDIDAIRIRHSGVLGLCAFISAFPYDVPDFVPDIFEHLETNLNDPEPISSTIRKTVGNFKRTHLDNWDVHRLKFTENQLAILNDVTITPSYYI